tara:strand:+ start:1486 stop:2181 length:696 start_codon:yes stop_codon:yes gene_type:complete
MQLVSLVFVFIFTIHLKNKVKSKTLKKKNIQYCNVEGCDKRAREKITGRCILHGGQNRRKQCKTDGCQKKAQDSKSGLCGSCGGGLRCDEKGCSNLAQDAASMKCISHGGKNRYNNCSVEGCNNKANSSYTTCIAHTTCKPKCIIENCKSNSVFQGKCTKHSGKKYGKKCLEKGCEKFARSGFEHCVSHGGESKKCTEIGCDKTAVKNEKCCSHGGERKKKKCTFRDIWAR